jgi:hypothetical protein
MTQPNVKLGLVSNLWSKQMHFVNAGDVMEGHSHVFDHLTLLAKGRLQVNVEGILTEFDAPHMIYIHKDKIHELVSLEDNTVAFCIHALRDKDASGDILDPDMIPKSIRPNNFSVFAENITNK